MDKYTVDLDKVLNDFEYSELTDQNNFTAGFNTINNSSSSSFYTSETPNQVSQPKSYETSHENQTHSKINTSVKHSMNNVFNSLNEYLNTEVKTEIEQPTSEVLDAPEHENDVSFVHQTSELPSIDDIFKNVVKEKSISGGYRSNSNVTETNPKNIELIFNSNNSENITNVSEKETSTEEPDNCAKNENNPEITNSNENNIFDNDLLVSIDDFELSSTKNNSYDVYSESNNPNSNVVDLLSSENIENIVEPAKLVSESETSEIQPKNATPVVGFEEISDISDTEVENELAELEREYKNRVDEKVEPETLHNLENTIEEQKDHLECNETTINKTVIECETDTTIHSTHEDINCDNIDNEEASFDTHCELSKLESDIDNKSLNEEKVESTIQETIEICDDEKIVEVTDEINEDKSSEIKENKEEIKNEIDEIPLASEDNQERRSSLNRPNSLDIATEGSSSSAINLIGDPGSTPYNNVYIKNTIPTEKPVQTMQGTETLSPTTSEISTSDNSDSAATDTGNDTSFDTETPIIASGSQSTSDQNAEGPSSVNRSTDIKEWLGKTAPFWTPDSEALNCMHCTTKFNVVKRRHHCRACGLVLCSKCCHLKLKLGYMDNFEARVCQKCYDILTKDEPTSTNDNTSDQSTQNPKNARLHPNNPMDYCSVVPPLQQVSDVPTTPPVVMVPVGVLKRKGSGKNRSNKSVMFCDGIRPGCDLTELDHDFNYKDIVDVQKKAVVAPVVKVNKNLPMIDEKTNNFIPSATGELPPIVTVMKTDILYKECENTPALVEMLKNEVITFALHRNLHVNLKLVNMDCCINKHAWCFSTEGLITVGQDEIVILLEVMDGEDIVPKDVFLHLANIYSDAVKGTSITEMSLSVHNTPNFLDSKNHTGFLYTRATFQCVQNIIIPKEPYLIGILIHRWETPWAKIFPLRLLLRLGAEYRYYPSPIISVRHRDSVYVEVGHTIINLLADFRNFSYTLPTVRGLTIHMEEKNTTVSIPANRYSQVMKALNNSSDHILAFAANFSPKADSHLVCIQDMNGSNENAYTTHAINIQNKPRKVTGASFIVLNGALKSTSGLTAKSSIVEDGLMIQILPEQMVKLRNSLRNMKDFKINCGCVNVKSDEFVNIIWTENDVNFNVGVLSPIDSTSLSGVPSIRVHNGKDHYCNSGNKLIRWTEVFIIQSGEENNKSQDPIDISKLSENISKATSQALVKYLDLLATNNFLKIAIRTTLHIDSVSYLAGSNSVKLPPIYMKSLDNELIPVLHKITMNNLGESAIILELIFRILNV